MADDLSIIAKRIEQLRTAKGLSQQKLADAIGVSRQSVHYWEHGVTHPEHATVDGWRVAAWTTPRATRAVALATPM